MKKSLLLLGLVIGLGLQNVKALNGNDQVKEELKEGLKQEINGSSGSHEGVMSNPTNMSKQPVVNNNPGNSGYAVMNMEYVNASEKARTDALSTPEGKELDTALQEAFHKANLAIGLFTKAKGTKDEKAKLNGLNAAQEEIQNISKKLQVLVNTYMEKITLQNNLHTAIVNLIAAQKACLKDNSAENQKAVSIAQVKHDAAMTEWQNSPYYIHRALGLGGNEIISTIVTHPRVAQTPKEKEEAKKAAQVAAKKAEEEAEERTKAYKEASQSTVGKALLDAKANLSTAVQALSNVTPAFPITGGTVSISDETISAMNKAQVAVNEAQKTVDSAQKAFNKAYPEFSSTNRRGTITHGGVIMLPRGGPVRLINGNSSQELEARAKAAAEAKEKAMHDASPAAGLGETTVMNNHSQEEIPSPGFDLLM